MKTVEIMVEGAVTGVGFRFSALREAHRYSNINGYVRNASERNVEAVVQGPDDEVDAFANWFRHGPPSAHVVSCTITPRANTRIFASFTIER